MPTNTYSALVTGGSRGIGRAIALAMHTLGYAVVVGFAGDQEAAQEVVDTIQGLGGKAMHYRCDVADFAQTKQMVDAAEAFAPIDVLVNNAGITCDGLLMRMSEQDFTKVIDVNLLGAFHTMRHAAALMMRRRRGSIVNITSVVGVNGNAGQANYAASKAGLCGLTKSAAKELAPRGITVNAVCPGFITTDMTAGISQGAKEQFMVNIPLARAGEPSDVANAVAFLCGEGARYITGHELHVDGGLSM